MLIWRLWREIKVEEQIWHLLAYGWNLKLWEWEERGALSGIAENSNIEGARRKQRYQEPQWSTTTKMAKMKNTDNTENADNSTVVKDADQLGLSCIAGGIQNATAILEKSWQFLIKLNTCILYYLPNLALNYVPKTMKT